jgi:hypothetical protein
MILQHPATGAREDAGRAFSLPALILGPVWFFVKGLTREGVLSVLGVIFTLGWGWLALPLVFPIVYRRHLERRGFRLVSPAHTPHTEVPGVVPPADHAAAFEAMHRDIARIPVEAHQCMSCGSQVGTRSEPIGFSRVIEKNTEFTGGKIKFTTRASILKTVVVFCENCWRQRRNFLGLPKIAAEDYALHPWWRAAQLQGFTTNLGKYEVERYR